MRAMRQFCNEINDMQPNGLRLRLSFSGDSFDELAVQSQAHGKEIFGAQEGPHLTAMSAMMELMNAGKLDSWMSTRKAEFEAL